MHARRFACLLLGIWLACSALTAWMATNGFHAAPRLLLDYSQRWNELRVMGAVFFFIYLLLGTREGKVTLGFTLILPAAAVFERAFLTPQLSYFGSLANLASRANQLRAVRMGVFVVEVVQLAAGLAVALLLIARQHGRSGLTREEVDAIDKADHRHVNW